MKNLILLIAITFSSVSLIAHSASTVLEGTVKKSEVITTKVGKNGRPMIGAAIGVGVGSAFGSGSGKDAAKIVGGLIGARKAAKNKSKTFYGWRYIVKANNELHIIDTWCAAANEKCTGIIKGKEVYVINGNEVAEK